MSNEMIERVAKAIFAYDFPTNKLTWEGSNKLDYLKMAKIAVEAMKEPTEAMLDVDYQYLYEAWKAMIEVALKDG